MKAKTKYRTFCGDFETTVYDGQTETEVWAAAYVEMFTEAVTVHNCIEAFFHDMLELLKTTHVKLYFHNLKFDGSFILDYFIRVLKYKQAYWMEEPNNYFTIHWYDDNKMLNKTIKYTISDMGEWYMIVIRQHNHFLMIIDSFKLLPFSLVNVGKSFKTKHQKLNIEYTGIRRSGQWIKPEEKQYIENDVLVMKEALEVMYNEGFDKLTIGACCLSEYKKILGKFDFNYFFPDLSKVKIDKNIFGSENADAYIRKAYRGGWCYLVRGKENTVFHNGLTLDVNSLYPSVMSGESNNEYPYGNPCFWQGDYIPEEAQKIHRFYFLRVKTRFTLKPGYLPTIQIKNNLMYRGNEYLETSRIRVKGEYCDTVTLGNKVYTDRVTLTLTCVDWELFKEHYDLKDCEVLDGCYFYAVSGIFDNYINKYRKIKMESTGARRTLAKLFLNNLYGKLATSANSSFKVVYFDSEIMKFHSVPAEDKRLVHIACGAAVTAYARRFTITAAQANYYGRDNPGFIYADTDSIHCDLPIEKINGVELSDTEFLKWKHESNWKEGIFIRQKTYIEKTETGYNVTACGMGKRCKELLQQSLDPQEDFEIKTKEEEQFLQTKRELTDFKLDLAIPSNLKQKRIKGGVVLENAEFHLR